MDSKRILIVDDHQVVIMGITQMLHNHLTNLKISGADDLSDTLKLLKEETFDLIILDINVPGGNKPSMIETIRRIQPGVRILIYSGCDESLYAYPYLQAGANGFLQKNAPEREFRLAVDKIMNNEKYLSPALYQEVIQRVIVDPSGGLKSLSSREIEILQLLKKGYSTAKIGETLFLQASTVSTHKMKIFKKLGVANVVELVEYVNLNLDANAGLAG